MKGEESGGKERRGEEGRPGEKVTEDRKIIHIFVAYKNQSVCQSKHVQCIH